MKVYLGTRNTRRSNLVNITTRDPVPDRTFGKVRVFVVSTSNGGATFGELHHHKRHSPDGFEWGYEGSGPAELARCILIDHFRAYPCVQQGAHDTECCDGLLLPEGLGGETVAVVRRRLELGQDADRISHELAREHDGLLSVTPQQVAQIAGPEPCPVCEDGVTSLPVSYQDFKRDIIGQIPRELHEWCITSGGIEDWIQSVTEPEEVTS